MTSQFRNKARAEKLALQFACHPGNSFHAWVMANLGVAPGGNVAEIQALIERYGEKYAPHLTSARS